MLLFLLATLFDGVKAIPTSLGQLYSPTVTSDEPEEQVGSAVFWWKIGISVALVLLGGAFAGLTIGLMGLDPLYLRVLATSADDPIEKRNAQKVLRLMRKGRHWVLVVLLLGNVVINESLPIFLDSAIGGGIAAILISTTTIVIFGEIIPQAVCARYGLSIGAWSAPVVLAMMYALAPIAWPIAKLLDHVLGEDTHTTYKKAELKSFLQFHRNPRNTYGTYGQTDNGSADHPALPLSDEEISILNGVLSLNEKSVREIMTPMKDVVTLSADDILDHELVDDIILSGYSRFPVHEPDRPTSFIGFLLVKRLLRYDATKPKRVGDMHLTVLPEAKPNINCFQALDYFQTGRAHLLLITDAPGTGHGALGVVTLEDIIEEIISEEIVDETDIYEDMHTKRKAKRQSTAAVMRGIVEREERKRRNSAGTVPKSISSAPGTPRVAPLLLGATAGTPKKAGGFVGETGPDERSRLLPAINETASHGSRTNSENGSPEIEQNGDTHGRSLYGATFTESPPREHRFI